MPINDIQSFSTTASSNADINGNDIAENCNPNGINNALRFLGKMLKEGLANRGSDITAASTTNIAATGTSISAKITGTTTITAFGTPDGNPIRIILWGAATPVTYNGTSMILMGGASKTYAAGDVSLFQHEGSGNWRELLHSQISGKALSSGTLGKHKMWVPASAMFPATTNPCAALAQTETANLQNYKSLDFDQTNPEVACFSISMPSSWDEGTLTFVPVWTAASGSGGVVWTFQARAFSNDDALDAAHSGSVTSTDSLIATGDLHRGPETSALTVAGTPAANDFVNIIVFRNPSDGSDTLNADAKLMGVEVFFTTDAAVDVA